MSTITSRRFASSAALGAAAVLAVGAGGYWAAARAQSPASQAVNPPAGLAARTTPLGAPTSFADIVAKVAPAVVSIDIEKRPDPGPSATALRTRRRSSDSAHPGRAFRSRSTSGVPRISRWPGRRADAPGRRADARVGLGFFISADGYIVTNNHVVDGADKITVKTSDGRELKAHLVGHDPATDLAVLKVEGGPFRFVSFEDHGKPRVGDWVVAVGNPFGLGGTATAGIVSALGRPNISGSSFVDYMQIDAPINRGNSGGPTFDLEGRVVGVNSAIFSPSGGSVGIGFDIPADVAAATARQLMQDGKVTRGYVGATVQSLSPELADSLGLKSAHGVVVASMTPGGPSERAGLKPGDVIVSVNGDGVGSAAEVTRKVALARPGDEIRLGVLRSGERREIAVRSGLRPTEASLAGADGDRPGE